MVAFLAVHGRTPRSVIAGALWPGSSDSHASGCLRTGIWRLGQAGLPVAERGSRHLALPEDFDVDVAQFLRWTARLQSGAPLADAELDPARVPSTDVLPGWSDAWVLAERERLYHLRLRALELLAVELVRRGRWAQAVDVATLAAQTDPLRETSVRLLVEIDLRRGEVTEARRRVEAFRRVLHDAIGITPSRLLTSLVEPAIRSAGGARV